VSRPLAAFDELVALTAGRDDLLAGEGGERFDELGALDAQRLGELVLRHRSSRARETGHHLELLERIENLDCELANELFGGRCHVVV
jgi:hypothetical protein